MPGLPVILITAGVFVACGLVVFFYWRTQYGAWAGRRGRAKSADKPAQLTVVDWDEPRKAPPR